MGVINAGDLDRRIAILRATTVQDPGTGGEVQAWNTLTTVSAAKKDVSDGERMKAAQVSAEISTRFTIRWSSVAASVNPKDRVLYEGRTFDIYSVKEVGRREGIEITGTARAD